eukprot:6468471-Amphidinium_carterae.2
MDTLGPGSCASHMYLRCRRSYTQSRTRNRSAAINTSIVFPHLAACFFLGLLARRVMKSVTSIPCATKSSGSEKPHSLLSPVTSS